MQLKLLSCPPPSETSELTIQSDRQISLSASLDSPLRLIERPVQVAGGSYVVYADHYPYGSLIFSHGDFVLRAGDRFDFWGIGYVATGITNSPYPGHLRIMLKKLYDYEQHNPLAYWAPWITINPDSQIDMRDTADLLSRHRISD